MRTTTQALGVRKLHLLVLCAVVALICCLSTGAEAVEDLVLDPARSAAPARGSAWRRPTSTGAARPALPLGRRLLRAQAVHATCNETVLCPDAQCCHFWGFCARSELACSADACVSGPCWAAVKKEAYKAQGDDFQIEVDQASHDLDAPAAPAEGLLHLGSHILDVWTS